MVCRCSVRVCVCVRVLVILMSSWLGFLMANNICFRSDNGGRRVRKREEDFFMVVPISQQPRALLYNSIPGSPCITSFLTFRISHNGCLLNQGYFQESLQLQDLGRITNGTYSLYSALRQKVVHLKKGNRVPFGTLTWLAVVPCPEYTRAERSSPLRGKAMQWGSSENGECCLFLGDSGGLRPLELRHN